MNALRPAAADTATQASGTNTKPRAALPRLLRKLIYWLLPPVLLALLFRLLDLERLQQLLRQADAVLLATGLLMSLGVVGLAAARWWLLAHSQPRLQLATITLFGDYWRSLAVGVLAPGSLGSDLYRIISLGSRCKRYLYAFALLMVDKAAALLACIVLLAVVPWGEAKQRLTQLLWVSQGANGSGGWSGLLLVVLATALTCASLAAWKYRRHWLQQLRRIGIRAERRCRRLARQAHWAISVQQRSVSATAGAPQLSWLRLTMALLLSLAVFAVSALQAHLFFAALGHPVPLAANLLVAPLLFMVLTVPLSFGGLGVREVAFVSFYALFGVPAEVSLLVSTIALLGYVANCGLGALLWLNKPSRY